MYKMFLLFSHKLTQSQKDDARASWGVSEFIELQEGLQTIWSNIPAELKTLNIYLEPLKWYLKKSASKDDIILIQGDFGGTYEMVNFCKENDFLAVHSTTKREVKETLKENRVIKTSTFEHVIFRRY